jgi:DNA-binding winged helix-turn-helix (wHTH) protein
MRWAPGCAANPRSPVAAPVAEKAASSSWVLQPESLVAPSGIALPLTQQEHRLMARLMRNPSEVCRKVDLHAYLFPDEVEAELHRIDVVISRLRNKARLHGMTLPIRAIFGKGLAFIPEVSSPSYDRREAFSASFIIHKLFILLLLLIFLIF